MTDYEKRLRKLLEKLFQFEQSDLDFGIYRIMNQKREEISKFIDKDLIEAVEEALAEYSSVNMEEIEHEIDDIKRRILETFGEGLVLPNGDVKPEFQPTPLAKEYEEKRRLLQQAEISEEHKAEIFNHIYQFFSRYYDNGDFISKRRYSSESKYAIPYNGEEVILHWANKDQYYIKTTEYFNNYAFEVGDYRVQFRIVSAETAQNNNQNGKRYFVLADADNQFSFDAENNELAVFFEYRELSSQEKTDLGNKQEAINEKIEAAILENIEAETLKNFLKREKTKVKKQGKMQSISMLLHHLNSYAKRNTSDYFIHKNLNGFLRCELDFYLKNEVLNLDDLAALSEGDLKRLMARTKVIKKIANRVIEFLAQIEGFQKKLWEKKKFVVRADYCMTLDRVPKEFYDEILANEAQLKEWKELYKLEEIEKGTLHWDSKNNTVKIDRDYLKSHPHMMLDTRFFPADFKDRLLATFENLDEATDGLIIKSENWQALNLLQEKYREKVKCIYIDPPYNAKSSEILYKNNFKHSSWLSLMENRIALGQRIMTDDGVFIIAIDENEQERLGLILDNIFPEHEKTCVAVIHNPGGIQGQNFSYCHEYAYFIFPRGGTYIGLEMREETADVRPLRDVSKGDHLREAAANCFYPIYVKDGEIVGFGDVCDNSFHPSSVNIVRNDGVIEIYPIDPQENERKWVFARQSVEKIKGELSVEYNKRRCIWDIIRTKKMFNYKTVWTDKKYNSNIYGSKLLNNILGTTAFSFPKSLYNVVECVNATTQDTPDALILDYFAGSGTTAHAVINLNMEDGGERKYIMVEMGEYFDTVLKPRIQKVVFASKWKDGVPQDNNGISHIFKYLYLEQYEDTLNNIEFVLPDGTTQKTLFGMDGYFLRYMLDFESRESSCQLNVKKLDTPFEYTMRIVENGKIHDNVVVDLVETFNYLLGLHVERIKALDCDGHYYRVVYGHKDHDKVVVVWRNTEGLNLARDKDFIETTILWDAEHTKLYVNGQCHVEDALSTEREFKLRIGA